jgi:hypothetical protein
MAGRGLPGGRAAPYRPRPAVAVVTTILPPSPDIPRQLDLLRRLCDQAERDYALIEKSAPFGFDVGEDGSKVGELIDQLRWLSSMGIGTVLGWVVGVDRITPIEIMGREVIPAVADLASA